MGYAEIAIRPSGSGKVPASCPYNSESRGSWSLFCKFFSPSVVEQRFLETMKAIQGALIMSSSIQIILGYNQLWGIFSRSLSFTLRSPSILALLLFPCRAVSGPTDKKNSRLFSSLYAPNS
ncbi:Superoxide dismutase [Fe] 3 chloroplastic [Zea mays]|uniref:Superoxide dismutase [Fe] 3 chloroplastic n=1 Tax=Zea mays TaxID=4577 RepID=A0A1D6GUM9_MAIZE|nr:Superoxide dismutase [Fe] 3 chloroplastic [Zea mays]AQK66681.1 Superoxide dismutase [Fe] 3 chloroplastic [Zea mays]